MASPAVSPAPAPRAAADLRRRAHARLAERVDLARSRHKPLSILRAEGKRVLEAFLDQEAALSNRPDRDRFIEDTLAESAGFGPLEELFRDDAVKEILVLAPALVVGLKNNSWTPTSARFRDLEQWRQVLARWAEVGDPGAGAPAAGSVDVRLANGFRVVAVVPPEIMDVPPPASLARGPVAAVVPGSGPVRPFAIGGSGITGGSGIMSRPTARAVPPSPSAITLPATPVPNDTARQPAPVPPSSNGTPAAPAPSAAAPDPLAKLRQRVAERIVMKFAAAGVYDLNQIPAAELRRIVAAHVAEVCQQERMGTDDSTHDRLALEILAGMNRSDR